MLESLLRVIALVRKELLAVFMDPRGRATIFIPPVLQCLIFGYAATFDLSDVPYAVWDQDRSSASYDLLAALDGSGVFRRVADLESVAGVRTAINERRALLVIQINQDFERQLLSGFPADVQVIVDGRNSNTGGTALGYVGTVVETFNAQWRAREGREGPTVNMVTRAWFNPNLETRWNMVPALIGTLTLLQVLLLTAMSVAREREQGTFDQLLVTPLRPSEIMAGKAIPTILIGIAQATLILLVAQLWFRIPFVGSFVTLYAGLSVFLMAAVGMGLLVSSIAGTMQQALLYSFMLLMPFTLLSGLATPLSAMPRVLQYVTLINPLRYAINIAHRVYLEGADLQTLMPQLVPLAILATITLSTASWMFRRRLA